MAALGQKRKSHQAASNVRLASSKRHCAECRRSLPKTIVTQVSVQVR
jgi:hypothetical protein